MLRKAMVLAVIALLVPVTVGAQEYAWQKAQAKVLPQGDLEWAPEPFVFQAGDSVRYIDFEGGKDTNPGTKAAPWKHHPWDAAATDNAAACEGVHTYVFKRGVIYRGTLVAKESGEPGNPIRLTSDPEWGTGEAAIYGSERLTDGWKRCTPADAPAGMPEPTRVWYRDIGNDYTPHALWEVRGDTVLRIPIAREPNWTVSNTDDPQSEWWEWTGNIRGKGSVDTVHLTQKDPDFFKGGYVWTEWSGNMGTIHVCPIEEYDPEAHSLRGSGLNGRKGNRYYIENVAAFLDVPGEYFYAAEGDHAGRLYVRLEGDRDPNAAVLEASRRVHMVDIVDKHDIVVSGLRFSFNDIGTVMNDWPTAAKEPTCIRVAGHCQSVAVTHNRFFHVMSVLNVHPRLNAKYTAIYLRDLMPWREDVVDDIAFNDNDIAYADRPAVTMNEGRMLTRVEFPPYGKLKGIRMLRNRFYWCGNRPGSNANLAIPTLAAFFAETAHIAGNIIDQSWGSGLFVFGGKPSAELGEQPLTRIIMHHNKITNAMLACNDYGGLEYWQGGPYYVYSNISGNSIGYRHYSPLSNDWKTVAYNVYLDGTFKSYTFNNIIWGKSNDPTYPYRNRGGYFVVLGFMNHFFNNTIYNFRHGIVGSSGNRSSYLSNVVSHISGSFIQQNRKGDTSLAGGGDTGEMGNRGVPTLAYARNVFVGDASAGNVGTIRDDSVEGLSNKLMEAGVRVPDLGWNVEGPVLADPAEHDFRPLPGAPVTDRGTKFFVPWGLYGTVGEWNFNINRANPALVLGENFYMTEHMIERHMYDLVPRNDLSVPGATQDDYTAGPLENFTDGVLRFNGRDRYAVIKHEDLVAPYSFNYTVQREGESVARGETVVPGRERKTVDMDTNSFLVEVYFRTEPGHGGSAIISKRQKETGYGLGFRKEDEGRLAFIVRGGGDEAGMVIADVAVNDGQWHHVLAEVDRSASTLGDDAPDSATGAMTIYVDGKVAGRGYHNLAPDTSLANAGDFLVGKEPDSDTHFNGEIDFLRVARGTLADAKTTIGELYEWQFNGPFLRDFAGRKPTGESRDAGALEAAE